MLRKIFIKSMIIAILFTISGMAFAIEKREYSIIAALGGDQPFSSGSNKFSTVLFFSWIKYFDPSDWYNEFRVTTTTASNAIGNDNGIINYGIKPKLAWATYGGWRYYDQGYLINDRSIDGNFATPLLFLDYKINNFISTGIEYRPTFYFYNFLYPNTAIDKPRDHWEHIGSIDVTCKNLEEKSMGLIKHGVSLNLKYEIAKRVGYGTYEEAPGVPASDINLTHRFYADLGLYYNFPGDYNLQATLKGAYLKNVDRNNSEQLGSLVADFATIPGYFVCEFLHDRFIMGKVQFGIPIPFWDTRVKPGFNILYMPKDNRVIAMPDYPKTNYKSVSVAITTKIANLIPFYLDYAYGIDAQRKSSMDGSVKTGSHEVRFFVVVAFGKNEKTVKEAEAEKK